MGIDKQAWEYEIKRLERVTQEIKRQLEKNKKIKEKYKNEILSIQKTMQENVNPTPSDLDDLANAWQFQVDIEEMGRRFKFLERQEERFQRMLASPYFGRVDFREDGEDMKAEIYIGIHNLTDEKSGELMVYDWRAPISSLFYDYETGSAGYKCPDGFISGEILLKRQYRIYNEKIEYMFDCSLKIDDEILQELLGKSSDGRMKTIVTTIQREQNRVIRDDVHKAMLVQGPAGSGKTSIILHRAAYLLYRYRESLSAENIVIFSPNQIFCEYISNVLPELGEENVQRKTFMDYSHQLLGSTLKQENMNELMEYLLSCDDKEEYDARISRIVYKNSPQFINLLKNYAKHLGQNGLPFEDIAHRGKVIISRDEILKLYQKDYAYLPVFKRLEKLRRRLLFQVEELEKQRFQQVMQQVAEDDSVIDGVEIKVKSLYIVREEFEPAKKAIENMTSLNLMDVYTKLFEDRELIMKLSEGSLPDCFDEIANSTVDDIHTNKISYEDIAPLVYLKCILGGTPDTSAIKHVIIDEIQDYSPIHLLALKLMFKNSVFALLGDPDQSINPYIGTTDFKSIAEIFGIGESAFINLSRSYRSTKEITRFCRAIIGNDRDDGYVERKGCLPEVVKVPDDSIMYKEVAESIKTLSDEGYRSVAVICRTSWGSLRAYERIKAWIGSRGLSLVTVDYMEFSPGMVVIPAYLAKGLEFDAVIVLDTFEDRYRGKEEAGLFYTACTRALHVLKVYYTGTMPAFLQGVKPEFYKHIEKQKGEF